MISPALSACASSSRAHQRASTSSSGAGVSVASSVGGVDERPEADHQRLRERPGLRGDVLDAYDLDAGLLAGLADHRLLRRLAGLDESGQRRPTVRGRALPAAEQAAIAGLHEHRDRRVGPRKLDQPAHRAAATVAGGLHDRDVSGPPAIALDAMPADQRDRVGRERRIRRLELGGEAAQRRELERWLGCAGARSLAAAGAGSLAGAGARSLAAAGTGSLVATGVIREQRHRRRVEPEKRELRVAR